MVELTEKDKIRFWNKVDKSGGPNACWVWLAGKRRHEYGAFSIQRNKKTLTLVAHRIAFELGGGIIGKGEIVRHRVCDFPPCCNPSHLRTGSIQDNSNDMVEKGRQRKGNNHPNTIDPSHMPRGDLHYARTKPHLLARGMKNGTTKFHTDIIFAIRKEYIPRKVGIPLLADKYNMSRANVWYIIRGATRKEA